METPTLSKRPSNGSTGGASRPRFRSFLQELRRELLSALTRITREDHGAVDAYELALADPKVARPYKVIYELAICSDLLLLGDPERAAQVYGRLDPDWATGRASRSLPAVIGALATEPVIRFGTTDQKSSVRDLLEPLSGTWAIVPITTLGPVDLSLGVLTAAEDTDPLSYFETALAEAQRVGSVFWEAEIRRAAGDQLS